MCQTVCEHKYNQIITVLYCMQNNNIHYYSNVKSIGFLVELPGLFRADLRVDLRLR